MENNQQISASLDDASVTEPDKARTQNWLVLAGRGATIVVLVLTCVWASQTWYVLLTPASPLDDVAVHEAFLSETGLPETPSVDGFWLLGGLSWNLTIESVSSSEVDGRLSADVSENEPVEAMIDNEQNVLQMLETLHVPVSVTQSGRRFDFGKDGFLATVHTERHDSAERIVGGRFAVPAGNGGDDWLLFEAHPSGAALERNQNTPHLLPFPESARRVCARWGGDGQLLLELVSVDIDADDLLATWSSNGWIIDRRTSSESDVLLCRSGDRCLFTWAAPQQPDRPLHVIVFESPEMESLAKVLNRPEILKMAAESQ